MPARRGGRGARWRRRGCGAGLLGPVRACAREGAVRPSVRRRDAAGGVERSGVGTVDKVGLLPVVCAHFYAHTFHTEPTPACSGSLTRSLTACGRG